jgi:hypothetical protein
MVQSFAYSENEDPLVYRLIGQLKGALNTLLSYGTFTARESYTLNG